MGMLHQDLAQFQAFAAAKVSAGEASSLESLFDLWLLENPAADHAAADRAAIERGVADAEASRTKPVGEAFAEVRRALSGE